MKSTKNERAMISPKIQSTSEKLEKEIIAYSDKAFEADVDLGKAVMALSELLSEYSWVNEPDPYKAIKYGSALGNDARKALGEDAENSWTYFTHYKKIIWLTEVALDYCHNALSNIDYIRNGGAANA